MKRLITIFFLLLSTYLSAQVAITPGMTGADLRSALNNNFNEVYSKLDSIPDYTDYLKFEVDSTIIPGNPGQVVDGSDSTYYTLPTFTGTTYYIDPSAVTQGNGSESSPFNSFNGVSLVNNNIYLLKRNTVLNASLPGVSGINVMFGAYGDTTLPRPIVSGGVIFTNSRGLIKDIEFRRTDYGQGIRFNCGSGNTWVYNCKVSGAGQGIVGYSCNNSYWDEWDENYTLYILYTEITDTWLDGIYTSSVQNVEIAHCTITNVTAAGVDGDGIQVQGPHVNVNIKKNYIERNPLRPGKFGIIITCPEVQVYPGSFLKGRIEANTINLQYTSGTSGIYLYGSSDSTFYINNNLIKNSASIGVINLVKTYIYYNIFENCELGIVTNKETGQPAGVTYAYNNLFLNYNVAALQMSISSVSVTSRNNLFLNTVGTGVAFRYNISSLNANYDHFYGTQIVSGVSNLATFRSTYSTQEVNGTEGDPMLNNIQGNNFRPILDSPLINSGVDVGLLSDYSYDNVVSPPSKGIYENINPPSGGTVIPPTPDTTVVDTVLVVQGTKLVIGNLQGKYAEFNNGDLYFKNGADLKLNWQNVPVADGEIGSVQFSDGILLKSNDDFKFKEDSSLLVTPGVRTGIIRFNDGTVMNTAILQSQDTSKYLIDTDYFTDTSLVLATPSEYILKSFQFRSKVNGVDLSIGNDDEPLYEAYSFEDNRTFMSDVRGSYSSDSLYITVSGNTSPGSRLKLIFEKDYLFEEVVSFSYLDGNTVVWLETDTATYYELESGSVEAWFDKAQRKQLGDELLSPIDFTLASWTKSGAVTSHSTSGFTTNAAGGVYRLFQSPSAIVRAVYALQVVGTTTSGSVTINNSNNSLTVVATMNAGLSYFTMGSAGYIQFRNSAASTTSISSATWKRVLGNNFGQSSSSSRPGFTDGSVTFNGSSQWLRTASSPTVTYQKVFIVGRQGSGNYYLYETLTGFGNNTGGVITLGASGESTPTTFYDVDIKAVVLRTDNDEQINEAIRQDLMQKYSVTQN